MKLIQMKHSFFLLLGLFSACAVLDNSKSSDNVPLFTIADDSVSVDEFKIYYENNHVPLIESLFPTLQDYKRTYLLESNMLNDALPLESEGGGTPFDVITELTFASEDDLNQFFARGAEEEVVDAILAAEPDAVVAGFGG